MTDISIPAGALEAATDLVLAGGFRLHPDEARAVFLAMVRAWPGLRRRIDLEQALILPLTETHDDKA